MSLRSFFAASVGGLVLCSCLATAPVAAAEPLRVIPAVRVVEEGQSAETPVVLTGHRGFYRGGWGGGYGYRSFGYGPRFYGGIYRSSFYSPYGYGLYRPYSFGIRPGFGVYYSSYRAGFAPYYSGFAPAYYGYSSYGYPSYGYPAVYAGPSVYADAYRPYTYSYAAPVYTIPTYGYTAPIYSGTSLYGGYYWNGCY